MSKHDEKKPDSRVVTEEKQNRDDILKAKFIERSLTKITSDLERIKKFSGKDYIIAGLLIILIIVTVCGNISASLENKQTEAEIQKLANRINIIEKKFMIPQDKDAMDAPVDVLSKTDTVVTGEDARKALPDYAKGISQDKVKTYKVDAGDTLSTIIWRCYQQRDPEVIDAFASYNKLTPPYYDIYPDMELKVPLLAELMPWYKANKGKTKSK